MTEKTIESFFEKVGDPRHHNKLHKLIDVMFIGICGVVAGADTYEQIENFGKKGKSGFQNFLNYRTEYHRTILLAGFLRR